MVLWPTMSLRFDRFRYFQRVSRKESRGFIYYEPWHRCGSYRQPRENRYKNIDRATIRKP